MPRAVCKVYPMGQMDTRDRVEKKPKDDPEIMGLYNSEIIDSRLDCRSDLENKLR
jgi:hypothetical protein